MVAAPANQERHFKVVACCPTLATLSAVPAVSSGGNDNGGGFISPGGLLGGAIGGAFFGPFGGLLGGLLGRQMGRNRQAVPTPDGGAASLMAQRRHASARYVHLLMAAAIRSLIQRQLTRRIPLRSRTLSFCKKLASRLMRCRVNLQRSKKLTLLGAILRLWALLCLRSRVFFLHPHQQRQQLIRAFYQFRRRTLLIWKHIFLVNLL
jgi:hypothetical protein